MHCSTAVPLLAIVNDVYTSNFTSRLLPYGVRPYISVCIHSSTVLIPYPGTLLSWDLRLELRLRARSSRPEQHHQCRMKVHSAAITEGRIPGLRTDVVNGKLGNALVFRRSTSLPATAILSQWRVALASRSAPAQQHMAGFPLAHQRRTRRKCVLQSNPREQDAHASYRHCASSSQSACR